MRDILLTVIAFSSLPVILFRPYVGILMWTWIGLMNPHRLTWSFAFRFPFAQVVAITTLLAALQPREPKRLPLTATTLVLLLFNLWMLVTTLFALEQASAWAQWNKVWKIQLMVFVTMILTHDQRRLDALVWTIALSIGFYGVKGGIFTIATGGQFHVLGPERSFISDNNHLAVALLMVIPLMRYLQQRAQNRWVRHGLTASMALTGFSIPGTQSRGALLGGAAIAVFLILTSRRRFWLTAGVTLAVVISLALMPEQWFERMETIQSFREDSSAMGRINAWHFAANLARDRPILGGGFETFSPELFALYAPVPDRHSDAHSIYFEVLAEHGYVGLALFLLLALLVWRSCSWIARRAPHVPDISAQSDLARMITVSLVGYAVSGAFVGLAYFDLYYVLVAIVIVSKTIVKERLSCSLEETGESRSV